MMFEVRFRGMNSFEAGDSQVKPLDASMLSWRPADRSMFEVPASAAKVFYEALVQAGVDKREVDGVVPYVVEICSIQEGNEGGVDYRTPTTLLWQYAEPGAVPEGPWTEFEPSGVAVGA